MAKQLGQTGPRVLVVVVGHSGGLVGGHHSGMGLQLPRGTDPWCTLGPPGAGLGLLVRNQTVLRYCAGLGGLRLVLGMVRVELSPKVAEVGHGGGRILEPKPGVEPRSPVNRAHMIDNIRLP